MYTSKKEFKENCKIKTDSQLATAYKVSTRTIYMWRKKLGIPQFYKRNIKTQIYQNKQSLQALCKTKTDPKIARLCNVRSKTIYEWRKRFKIKPFFKPFSGNRLYSLNHDYFSNIQTAEQAYILGFICADGFVHKSKKAVSIYIQEGDKYLLQEIKFNLNSTTPIKMKIRTNGFNPGGKLVGIDFYSKKLVSGLANLGVTNNKSKTIKYPSIPFNLDRHFIRGVFDGDGHIGPRQFGLTGSIYMLDSISQIAKKHIGTTFQLRKYNGSHRIWGGKAKKRFLDWIYQNQTLSLERKYKRYIKYWS